jgi:hypothetical protein
MVVMTENRKKRLSKELPKQTVTYAVRVDYLRSLRALAAERDSSLEWMLDHVLGRGLEAARTEDK